LNYVVLLVLAALAALGLPFLLKKNGSKPGLAARVPQHPPGMGNTIGNGVGSSIGNSQHAPPPTEAPAPMWPAGQRPIVRGVSPHIEAMLRDFEPTRAEDLPPADAVAIMALLDRIPRPPGALHKLVSPAFLASANTAELTEMVMAEPQVAAKVLAVVNSPFYGMKAPLASIGQAVTFLGLNTVRGICLQYLLSESFPSKDPEVKKIFDSLWHASAFASELCFKLAQQLQLPEPGALVTQVVLSFLGPLTSHALLPRDVALGMPTHSFLERSRIEQDALGLCAGELGSLLMQKWELPPGVVAPVREMDRVLRTPCGPTPSTRQARMAFCYFCARLGELLALGSVQDLSGFVIVQEQGPDLYYFQTYLQQPGLEQLQDALHRPEMVGSINAMLRALQTRP
jgi:HD-like signal output (HDOD) protein